jgi:very-short-patch-repair endonuclease
MSRTSHLGALRASSNAQIAKELRSRMTDAEQRLWYYVVDFLCEEARLIVEIDGGQHAERIESDSARTEWLAAQGYAVIRFWNNDVLKNTDGVLATLSPALSQGRGRTSSSHVDGESHS